MLKNLRYKTKVKIKNRKGALVMNIERKILVKLKNIHSLDQNK